MDSATQVPMKFCKDCVNFRPEYWNDARDHRASPSRYTPEGCSIMMPKRFDPVLGEISPGKCDPREKNAAFDCSDYEPPPVTQGSSTTLPPVGVSLWSKLCSALGLTYHEP